jgi:hypothetical protein
MLCAWRDSIDGVGRLRTAIVELSGDRERCSVGVSQLRYTLECSPMSSHDHMILLIRNLLDTPLMYINHSNLIR